MSLDELGLKYRTDKASYAHDYLGFYEQFLAPRRHDSIRLLEIGVADGASLRMWRDYFPNGQVVGFDINERCVEWRGDRIEIVIGDQAIKDDLLKCGDSFDIIVDDGGHNPDHQILAYETLVPRLNPSGIYILEDILTDKVAKYMANLALNVIGVWPALAPNVIDYRDNLVIGCWPAKTPMVFNRITSVSFYCLSSVTLVN